MSTHTLGAPSTIHRPETEEAIIAEVTLDHSHLFLRPTLRDTVAVTVEPEYWTTVSTGRTLLFLTAYGETFDGFEAALETDPTVDDPTLLEEYSDRRVYRVALTERAVTFTAMTAEVGGRVFEISSAGDGWVVQLRLPGRDALVSFNEHCRECGITVSVNHLHTGAGGEDCVIGLTPKQEELLTVAYEEGYFEVPRGISQHELAERLGVSKSAISQRLRRAISELCTSSLA